MKIGIVGVRGPVGREMVRSLDESSAKVTDVRFFGGATAHGSIAFRGADVRVLPASARALAGLDLVLFSPSSARTPELIAAAARSLDVSRAARGDAKIPLVIDAVNGALAAGARHVAIPGAATTLLALALAPLHRAAKLSRVDVTLLESASGAAARGPAELSRQATLLLSARPVRARRFPHRLAFNLIPEVGGFAGDFTSRELAVPAELRRLFSAPNLAVHVNAVRVPVMYGHAAAISAETERPVDAEEARKILRGASSVKVVDAPTDHVYPMPLLATGDDDALVGRLRAVPGGPLQMFAVQDNIRAVAVNAIRVALAMTR